MAYSPISDFPRWYDAKRSGLSPTRVLIELARWQLRVDSGAPNHEEFERMLRLASPLYMAEYIKAPVLLVHGADDTLAPPDESERMAEALKTHGVTTKLVIVPGGERLFNFRQERQATAAWNQTLDWLDRHLRPAPRVTEQATR